MSSHFSPRAAPQVADRTACACLRVGFLAFLVAENSCHGFFSKTIMLVRNCCKSRLHSSSDHPTMSRCPI